MERRFFETLAKPLVLSDNLQTHTEIIKIVGTVGTVGTNGLPMRFPDYRLVGTDGTVGTVRHMATVIYNSDRHDSGTYAHMAKYQYYIFGRPTGRIPILSRVFRINHRPATHTHMATSNWYLTPRRPHDELL